MPNATRTDAHTGGDRRSLPGRLFQGRLDAAGCIAHSPSVGRWSVSLHRQLFAVGYDSGYIAAVNAPRACARSGERTAGRWPGRRT